ncbi:MAG: hypothetical protein JNJ59_11420 [Deltaproteobacteria bacterium]|nr:hypothetical protein [Deltaproteobacteria bacterium]
MMAILLAVLTPELALAKPGPRPRATLRASLASRPKKVPASRIAAAAKRPRRPKVTLKDASAWPVPSTRADDPTFYRAYDCKPRRLRADLRTFYDCAGDEVLAPGASELTRNATPRTVPSELVGVFRSCPFAPVAALDAEPDRFFAYEDRDVGRCYVLAPIDRQVLPSLDRHDPRRYLQGLHPYLAAAMERALAEAKAAGFDFRVISGNRSGGRPNWHQMGLAVDVNLAHRKGLKEATAAYLSGQERDAWLFLASAATRYGLYWLGAVDPDEIFHFEWRPGWTGLPHGDLARDLAADLERGGPPLVWERLRYDPTRPNALTTLRDPPVP